MKEDGLVGLPLCMHEMGNSYGTLVDRVLKIKDLLEDPDVDDRLMLRYIYIHIYVCMKVGMRV